MSAAGRSAARSWSARTRAVGAAMVKWRDDAEDVAGVRHRGRLRAGPAAPQHLDSELPPGPEQVMSDASPNRPTESIEDKPEEKIEHKVVEEGTARSAACAQSRSGGRAAVAGGQAGSAAAAGAARASAGDHRAAGHPRSGRSLTGRAHAGTAQSPSVKCVADLEDPGLRVAGTQQALPGRRPVPRRAGRGQWSSSVSTGKGR